MQVLPTTAADKNVNIDDIEKAEQNVHAGVKYLRFLRDRYFSDEAIESLDRVLFSFAAYNAGPANITRARKKAASMGFDSNQWFNHVEVAASKTISREPVVYVRNIYKYYVAYKRLEDMRAAREAAVDSSK
jgi:membrane-bound lytic murein transglycosylase MltF